MAPGMTGAVLWDLDGTLVDSEEYHWRAWRDTMAAEGVPITREQFIETFGWRNDAIIPRWLGNGATPERVERIGDAKEANYRSLVRQNGIEPLPGADEWVHRLNAEGWLQAVASSAPRLNIEVVLEVLGLAGCFQAIVSAGDVHRGKPDPEVFLLAAERLGVPPERSVVVEDARAGIEAARRAGMRCIALSRKGAKLGADLEVTSFRDLPPQVFCHLLGRS
jgi:beta-phosphoglucomutase